MRDMDLGISVTHLEIIRNPIQDGYLLRGIIRNDEMPTESHLFCQSIAVPHLIKFDVDNIEEEDIPLILAKLAAMADAKTKKQLPAKEVIILKKKANARSTDYFHFA